MLGRRAKTTSARSLRAAVDLPGEGLYRSLLLEVLQFGGEELSMVAFFPKTRRKKKQHGVFSEKGLLLLAYSVAIKIEEINFVISFGQTTAPS